MIKSFSFIVFYFTALFIGNSLDIDSIRTNFVKATSDKKLCFETIKYLEENKSTAINLAYLGGYQSVSATHLFSPFEKLKYFNKGKKNIELAIKNEPNNPEIRFIRLSIQKKAPKFLGYHSHIEADVLFLKKHRNEIDSEVVQKLINDLLND